MSLIDSFTPQHCAALLHGAGIKRADITDESGHGTNLGVAFIQGPCVTEVPRPDENSAKWICFVPSVEQFEALATEDFWLTTYDKLEALEQNESSVS